jgi:hypothetical protein
MTYRVEGGSPTPEELAAIVGVLWARRQAAAAALAAAPAAPVSRWRMSALPAIPLRPGPGAWRAAR